MKAGGHRDVIPDVMCRIVANDDGPRAGSTTSGVDDKLGLQVTKGAAIMWCGKRRMGMEKIKSYVPIGYRFSRGRK